MNPFFVSFLLILIARMKNYRKIISRISDMLILVFLALNEAAPSYISDLFTEHQTNISLRGKCRLVIPRVNITNYGLHFNIMRANYGTYCRIMSMYPRLLLPSKMHYELSI